MRMMDTCENISEKKEVEAETKEHAVISWQMMHFWRPRVLYA